MKKYPIIKQPKAWLEAIDKTIKEYRNETHSGDAEDCAFCQMGRCATCLHELFEEKHCTTDPSFFRVPLSETYKRLNRWKRIIKAQIKRKEAKKK